MSENRLIARQAKGKFAPGVSGNPGGRPKSERHYLIEQYGEDGKALHVMMDAVLASDRTPANVRVDILKFKLERLAGKAPLTVDVPQLGAMAEALARKVVHELHPGPTQGAS